MGKEMIENVNDDGELEELEMLLNEIPQATSHNLVNLYHRNGHDHGGVDDDHGPFVTEATHKMGCMYDDDPLTQIQYPFASSPVSGFSLQSDGSSSSLFSVGHALSDTGSPSPPTVEDLKSTMPSGSSCLSNRFWLDSMTPDSTVMKAYESLVDELGICANLCQMYISNQQENRYDSKNASMGMNRLPFPDSSLNGNSPINAHKHGDYYNFKRGFLDGVGVQSPLPRSAINHDAEMNSALSGLTHNYGMSNLFGSRHCANRPETILPQLNGFSASIDSPMHRRKLINNYYYRGNQPPEPTASLSRNPMDDAFLYAQKNGMNIMEETGISRLPSSSHCTNLRPHWSVQNLLQYNHSLSNNARAVPPLNARIPQGNIDAITSEGSFIIQGEGSNYVVGRGLDRSRCQSKAAERETGFAKHIQRSELGMRCQVLGTHEIHKSYSTGCSFPLPSKYNSLAEARGYVYLMAKDQHGCRFLQRMFDEGTPEDVQVIFEEIIDHVVELMVNPFGNYLMQKLLDVCNEEQRTQILLIITEEPGQLVRISLNTHGTRVVQKLIETLKTRQQISLAVSALEPGFLALIKDLNGNHVIQRCLLCLNSEDNKFIFVAAAKYCVDIATHQHGCCVLQRCIAHSSGEHREKLIAEISANALLLAQDHYGNYVVQFIMDLRIPSATTNISSQFEGYYVHLSRHKFGSHVVEKCLSVFNDENRSRVIHELLSAPHFEHLLQDPHANYVVQSALRHSEGRVHNLLVEAVESHKAISRNSPYSKKIFSQKLLKK
ncbi:putative pumilio homolog 7, chloroplastic [Gastrolobium bilobum]|uniref:putative pumilio homolog 7, chloroplastic n=1 Tax=Gastrolobium bilobum TaxID=150636 RepID=UPI002AB29D0B|nr:putative pumilio homolog 7, chloroplastic [Gastrolobium bilobum]